MKGLKGGRREKGTLIVLKGGRREQGGYPEGGRRAGGYLEGAEWREKSRGRGYLEGAERTGATIWAERCQINKNFFKVVKDRPGKGGGTGRRKRSEGQKGH
jgi:hypothetical protein